MVVVDGYGNEINEVQCLYGGFGTQENAAEFAQALQKRLDTVCSEYEEVCAEEQSLSATVVLMRQPRLKHAEDDLREALGMDRRLTP
jgi:hypothetical protein